MKYLLPFVLLACSGTEKTTAQENQILEDRDGDGFNQEEDCNDNDAAVNPNGTEICDGTDNNCDGEIDEGVQNIFYADSDGDGFGSIHYPETKCPDENGEGPPGYVQNYNDCDDNHAESHPFVEGIQGGVEVWQ